MLFVDMRYHRNPLARSPLRYLRNPDYFISLDIILRTLKYATVKPFDPVYLSVYSYQNSDFPRVRSRYTNSELAVVNVFHPFPRGSVSYCITTTWENLQLPEDFRYVCSKSQSHAELPYQRDNFPV